ncbi:MAG: DUF1501 domain-containing protein [Planctomycetaceae bacterium]
MENATNGTCPGPLNRRSWLQLGGLSLGALAAGVPPGLSQVLANESRVGTAHQPNGSSRKTAGGARRTDFSVILFWANGGPSHVDLFDLKPDAPAEIRGPFRPIRTSAPGMEITELLPNLARLGDRIALVRSLHHKRPQHSGGTNRFLTGYSSVAANLADSEFPEIGSVVAKHLDAGVKDLPLFAANTKFYGGGPAYLGQAYAPYMPAAKNGLSSSGNNRYDPIPIYPTKSDPGGLTFSQRAAERIRRRAELLKTFESLRRNTDRNVATQTFDKFQQRALDILVSPRTRDAFDISRESEATRQRYGDTHWGRSLLTCRRLVEAGVRFVQCQATYRLKPETGRTSNWDDHSVNADIFKAYREKLPSFDQSVPALIEDLHERGMDKHVLFLFCGEFGRTPRIRHQDATKRPGRDHWASAMSVLLSGGGLKMGQVIGATNRRGEEPVSRAMNSNCLLATIYRKFGIDTHRVFHDATGRPIPILREGEPIRELL